MADKAYPVSRRHGHLAAPGPRLEIHPLAARELPIEPQRIQAVPLPRRHCRVPFLEPERCAAPDAPARAQDGRARDEGRRPDGRTARRVTTTRSCLGVGNAAPSLQSGRRPPRRTSRISRARRREDDANRPIGQRANAGEIRRVIRRLRRSQPPVLPVPARLPQLRDRLVSHSERARNSRAIRASLAAAPRPWRRAPASPDTLCPMN